MAHQAQSRKHLQSVSLMAARFLATFLPLLVLRTVAADNSYMLGPAWRPFEDHQVLVTPHRAQMHSDLTASG
jgi:hypothetical protein